MPKKVNAHDFKAVDIWGVNASTYDQPRLSDKLENGTIEATD